MAEASKPKEVEVTLEFPVSVNGVTYPKGKVKVSEDVAAGIKDVVEGVAAEKAYDEKLKARAVSAKKSK